MSALDRISLELTNRCTKACSFCYNASDPAGRSLWDPDDVVTFVSDCAAHGVQAVSFGGGEPLQYDGVFDVLHRLKGRLFRSVTTNGLLLNGPLLARLALAAPEKVHVSLHFPEDTDEVERVSRNVSALTAHGIRAGVNLLVARSKLDPARRASERLQRDGIGMDRIIFLPMRVHDTPTPEEVGRVAGTSRFQSTSCLAGCASSPRFCSLRWDRTVAWCSYTSERKLLSEPSFQGLTRALQGLGLKFCGGIDAA